MSENENNVTSVQVVSRESSLSLKQIADRVNLVHQVLDKVMKKGTHYGTVPGCGDKLVLLKPGADVLAMTFRLVPRFEVTRTDLEGGHREYDVTCSMYGSDGTILGQGVGSASTMEKKYRYRKEYGENGTKKDSYGKKYNTIENEDIADTYNTVLKIAKKRAHVDATLTVTGSGDLFTQDLIDDDEGGNGKPPIAPPKRKEESVEDVKFDKPSDARPEPTEEDYQEVEGTLKDVQIKDGVGKNGKPWTRYGIVMSDGKTYGTFDTKLGDAAQTLNGENVRIRYKQEGKFRTLVGISPMDGADNKDENTPF